MVRFREDEVGERVGHGSVQFQSRTSNVVQMGCPVGGQSREVRVVSVQKGSPGPVRKGSPGLVQDVQIVSRMFRRGPGERGSGRRKYRSSDVRTDRKTRGPSRWLRFHSDSVL